MPGLYPISVPTTLPGDSVQYFEVELLDSLLQKIKITTPHENKITDRYKPFNWFFKNRIHFTRAQLFTFHIYFSHVGFPVIFFYLPCLVIFPFRAFRKPSKCYYIFFYYFSFLSWQDKTMRIRLELPRFFIGNTHRFQASTHSKWLRRWEKMATRCASGIHGHPPLDLWHFLLRPRTGFYL